MGAAEKFYLTIQNESKTKTLIFKNIVFSWGRTADLSGEDNPVTIIPPGKTLQVLVAQGRDDTSSGTEGTIKYFIQGNEARWVTASWDVPWLSGKENTCELKNSDDEESSSEYSDSILWEAVNSTSSSGTTLSVVVKFGMVIVE